MFQVQSIKPVRLLFLEFLELISYRNEGVGTWRFSGLFQLNTLRAASYLESLHLD